MIKTFSSLDSIGIYLLVLKILPFTVLLPSLHLLQVVALNRVKIILFTVTCNGDTTKNFRAHLYSPGKFQSTLPENSQRLLER
ncbi:MAG: hypothetical protein DID90_2727553237 [Candidatus Nitrotoga sp. LAW]|nr:MAG: hypothetical protein DID90_2727553237 [Candidatus Nitrotoga sp. LAW]